MATHNMSSAFLSKRNLSLADDDAVQKGLRDGIEEYMNMTSEYFGYTFSNRYQARCKLLYLLALALFNCAFTFYNVHQVKHSLIHKWSTVLEFCAVVACVFKAISNWIGASLLDGSDFQAYNMVEDLESAGSFSLLWFLPFPAKLLYWWNNKAFLFEEYISDPPTTCLHWVTGSEDTIDAPQFRPWLTEHWRSVKKQCFQNSSSLFAVGAPCILFGWVIVRILIPVLTAAFVLLSLPAAIMKMLSIADAPNGFVWVVFPKGWTYSEYFQALGVLNQMSKIWSPQFVENVGYMRHLTATKMPSKGQPTVNGRIFRRNLIICAYNQLPKLDAISFFAVLDIGTVGKCLNRGFTPETPYSCLHEVKLDHRMRIVRTAT